MTVLSAMTWALMSFAVLFVGSSPRVRSEEILARTPLGVLRGTQSTSLSGREFYSFRGIPYAKPPVGNLRFAPPLPVGPWNDIKNATFNTEFCIQKNYLLPGFPMIGQEDCLYLNVYTPKLPKEVRSVDVPNRSRYDWRNIWKISQKPLLPVMVYIHGGGLFSGTASSLITGPRYIMNSPDILLVTLNYRLGAFGFLSTGDEWATGNWGLKDQVEALKWVRDNIEYFGGDPGRVTIFGQSAGAASVHYHMLSPLSRGLFHASITQSGSALSPWIWPQGDPRAIARKQGELVGCNDTDSAHLIECLRGIDAEKITDSGDGFKYWSIDPLTVYRPVVESGCIGLPPCLMKPDEPFITAHPYILAAEGSFNPNLPWMMGVVPQEGILRAVPIMSNPSLVQDFNDRLDELGPRLFELDNSLTGSGITALDLWKAVAKKYLTKTPGGPASVGPETAKGFIDAYTDRGFLHALHKSLVLHSRRSHFPLYLYEFTYRGSLSYVNLFANTTNNYGVSHCDDLLYLFDSPLVFPDIPPGSKDMDIINRMVTLWTNFAKYGNPTPDDSLKVHWEPVRPGCHNHMEIGVDMVMKQELHEQRLLFWDSLSLWENQITSQWQPRVAQIHPWTEYLLPIGHDCDKFYHVNGNKFH